MKGEKNQYRVWNVHLIVSKIIGVYWSFIFGHNFWWIWLNSQIQGYINSKPIILSVVYFYQILYFNELLIFWINSATKFKKFWCSVNIDETMVFKSLMYISKSLICCSQGPFQWPVPPPTVLLSNSSSNFSNRGRWRPIRYNMTAGYRWGCGEVHRIYHSLFCAKSNFNVKFVSTSHL